MEKIVEEYRELSNEIATACKDINPTLREVILQRYVDGIGWDEIALKLNYSESYIYELHRKAISLITE